MTVVTRLEMEWNQDHFTGGWTSAFKFKWKHLAFDLNIFFDSILALAASNDIFELFIINYYEYVYAKWIMSFLQNAIQTYMKQISRFGLPWDSTEHDRRIPIIASDCTSTHQCNDHQ